MDRQKYKNGDKVIFIDEKEYIPGITANLYSVCTIVMEFDVDTNLGELDRVIAIKESPHIVYRPNQFISLTEFRKQKIEKCLKRVIK